MIDFRPYMQAYFHEAIKAVQQLDADELNMAVNAVLDVRERGGVIYTMGNGGSAATASHFVCDFAKGAYEKCGGRKFLFECLCDNTAIVTAISNDISYDDVFRFQLENRVRSNDLIIAISGSGNSKNIIKAVEYAKSIGALVIGLTAYDGGKLRELADYRMHVNINDMQIAEDVHIIFVHMMLRAMAQYHAKDN